MPRFYFDLNDGLDPVGAELSDQFAAHVYAMRLAGDIIRDLRPEDSRPSSWRMDIRQDNQPSFLSLVFEVVPSRRRLAEMAIVEA